MELCRSCLMEIISKLTPNDVYVLYRLRDKTDGKTGENRSQLYEALADRMSIFQLSQALMRMELLGFINSFKVGKTFNYYITNNGLAVLEILSKQ